MRDISGGTLAYLAKKTSIDPAFIIGIQWVIGGDVTYYSDRTLLDIANVSPTIVQIGELDQLKNTDSSGQSNSVTITLSDIDGSLKNIFDNNDIHKRTVTVYQYFISTSPSDKFLLFAGQISTPIIWDEGQRTLVFDVVTKVEDNEVGFSVEQGAYASVALKLIGQPWPMIFGTVLHSPGLALQEIPSAFTAEPFSIPDQSIIAEVNKLNAQLGSFPLYNIAHICGRDLTATEPDCDQEDANQQAFQAGIALQAQLDQLQGQIKDLQNTLNIQRKFQRSRVDLIPTMQVTQPYTGVMKVGSQLFNGHIDNLTGWLDTKPLLEPGNYDITKQLIKAGYQFYNSGTQVSITGNYPIVWVASIVPGTVTAVYAFRSFKGLRQLVKVPEQYYTIQTLDFGVEAVCVIMTQPLSTVAFLYDLGLQNWENNFGQYLPPHLVASIDWEDQPYFTFESSVGPNPVDVMIYLIDTYTSNSYDTDNFAAVRDLVAVTPFNFMYQQRDNVLALLDQLAYQCRCAIYLVEDVFHLVFLPASGTAVDTLTESDVIIGTLQVTTTPTENLVTIYEASFRPDYSPTFSDPVRSIFRFNVKQYGYHTESHDFFALNSFDVVEKVATFWMIRKSMTWKLLKCKLHLTKLNLEVFDTVQLAFNRPYVATLPVPAMITSANYNIDDRSIDVEFWTPVRLGEMVAYDHVWDTGIDIKTFFPTFRDIQSGAAGGISGGEVRDLPPMNGIRLDIQLNNRGNFTQGDRTPLGNYGSNPDGSPIIPSNLGLITPLPGDDPGFDTYDFPDAKPTPTAPDRVWSAAIPATILDYISTDDSGRQTYSVNMFRNGVTGPGSTTAAILLQLDLRDRVPNGTNGHVYENKYLIDDAVTGKKSVITQRTFQVAIWLR